MIEPLIAERAASQVTVVVRTVGERTETLCLEILHSQLPLENVIVIRQRPFARAHRDSVEAAIETGRPWAMVTDSDKLVRPGAVLEMLRRAQKAPPQTFMVHTLMVDKFFGGERYVGPKLYRTELLDEALSYVPESANVHRPETEMSKAMRKKGYPWYLTRYVSGVHDFEQAYGDILRKGFTHGKKSARWAPTLEPYWQRAARFDPDFAVLLEGIALAADDSRELQLDIEETAAERHEVFERLHLEEKPPLTPGDGALQLVEKLLAEHEPPPEYLPVKRDLDASTVQAASNVIVEH